MSQREQVLHALKVAGRRGVENGQFNRMGIFRYSARLHELRNEGYLIRTENGKGGLARFYLDSGPTSASPSPAPSVGQAPSTGDGEQVFLFESKSEPVSAIWGDAA